MKDIGPRHFTILVPAFNEAASLEELVERVRRVMAGLGQRFDLIVVNDGSTDQTEQVVLELSRRFPWVGLISLRRNCGKALAVMAGFRATEADVVITMDADLQDRPEDISTLLAKIDEGYDLVSGWRQARIDKSSRKLGSRLFNFTVRLCSGLRLKDFNCGFKAYRGEVIKNIVVYGQYHRYIPLIAHLAGFRVGEAPVGNDPRKHGVSKYRTFRYQSAFDLMSILFTHRYGLSPLHFFGVIAAAILIPSGLIVAWFACSQALYMLGFGEQYMVNTRPLLFVALASSLAGLLFFALGFICDFILHHQISARLNGIIDFTTRLKLAPKIADPGSRDT